MKYTLWDYLKTLGNYEVRQIANLAQLYGMLIGSQDLPMHFLKVIDLTSDEGMTKPQILFMYILFNYIYENHTKDQIKLIFQ